MKNVASTDWKDLPGATRCGFRGFVLGDIHGDHDLFSRMIDLRQVCDQKAGTSSQMVFLGDLIDRGPHGLKILRDVFEMSRDASQALVLPGNHEAMLYEALLDEYGDNFIFDLWEKHGGKALLREAKISPKLPDEERRNQIMAALPEGFMTWCENTASHKMSEDILFVHAGILPPGLEPKSYHPKSGTPASLKEYLNQDLKAGSRYHWAWIREPFLSWKGGWGRTGRRIVVHGHSSATRRQIHCPEDILRFCDRTEGYMRINLDIGAPWTKQLAALEIEPSRYRIHLVFDPS